MDICPSDDLAVNFGSKIIQSKKDSVFKDSGKVNDYGGLFLGNRKVVVVSVDGGQEKTPVTIVDHGVQQKEATRRLFEAHVYTQSYQKEVSERNADIKDLAEKLQKAEQQINILSCGRTPVNDVLDVTALDGSTQIKIQGWLRDDQQSRELISHFVKQLGNGESDRQELTDQLWTLLQAGVNRWNGDPDAEVAKQAEAAEKRSREVLAKALKESSEMHSHFHELQRKNKDLHDQVQQMLRQSSSGGGGGRVSSSPRLPPAVEGSSLARRTTLVPGVGDRESHPFARLGGQTKGNPEVATTSPGVREGHRFSTVDWSGEHHEIDVADEEMERIDHEVFEPMTLFDKDMTKLMEEMVNEKVKRILLLDPQKFQNRLPYGLRSELSDDDYAKKLLDENRLLSEKNKKMAEQLINLQALLEQLGKRLEAAENAVKQQQADKPPEVIYKERGNQTDTVEKTWKDDEVQKAIKAAVDKVTEEFDKQRSQLEEQIKKMKADLENAKKEAAEAKTEAAALQARLEKLQSDWEKDRKELARLKTELEIARKDLDTAQQELTLAKTELETARAANRNGSEKEIVYVDKLVEKVVEKPHPEHEETIMALNKSQAMLQRLCNTMSNAAEKKHPDSHARFRRRSNLIESHIGRDYADQDFRSIGNGNLANISELADYSKAMPVFAEWCDDLVGLYSSLDSPSDPNRQISLECETKEVLSKAEQEEMEKLKAKCRQQQEEISRLLLMIEEMRHRLEKLQFLLEEKGYTDETLQGALEKVGLQDLMQAKKRDLVNVYERLYQDAVERLQRSALTLEQRIEASKLYYAGITANNSHKGPAVRAPPPKLDQLTEAACTAIHGMWYHYDILFKRVCERSTAEALKNSAINKYRLALADIFGDSVGDGPASDLGSLFLPGGVLCVDDGVPGGIKQKTEPFSDRRTDGHIDGDRRKDGRTICPSVGVVSPGGGIAFGRQRQRPQSGPSGHQREPSSFKAFLSQQTDGTRNAPAEARKLKTERPRSSIGALTQKGRRPGALSQSLPALPKGLSNLKSASNVADLPNSAATQRTSYAAFASTSCGGLTSGESSLVFQDSCMSASS